MLPDDSCVSITCLQASTLRIQACTKEAKKCTLSRKEVRHQLLLLGLEPAALCIKVKVPAPASCDCKNMYVHAEMPTGALQRSRRLTCRGAYYAFKVHAKHATYSNQPWALWQR